MSEQRERDIEQIEQAWMSGLAIWAFVLVVGVLSAIGAGLIALTPVLIWIVRTAG